MSSHLSDGWDEEILSQLSSLENGKETRCDMNAGQYEVKYSNGSGLKLNCSNIIQAVGCATAAHPSFEIVSVNKVS